MEKSDRDGLIAVGAPAEEPVSESRLLVASRLDEFTILELMVAAMEDPASKTVPFETALTGLLAKEVLKSGCSMEGPSLVLTLAGLLKRGHRFSGEKGDPYRALLTDLTFDMRGASGRPAVQAIRAVQLGDRAIHAVAGFSHRPTQSTSSEYMLDRAASGYGTAIELSERFPEDPYLSRTAASLVFFREVSSLKARIRRGASILSSLLKRHPDVDRVLNGGTIFGTMGSES